MTSDTPPWTWDELILALHALGGRADNVVPGNGQYGRGLFPLDKSKPFYLYLPERLLFQVDDIEFVDDRIRIKDAAPTGAPERDFFENYQRSFSWGVVGHSDCAAFIDALDELPPEVGRILQAHFGIGYGGEREAKIREWFLQCRIFGWNGRKFLLPVIELMNYSDSGFSFEFAEQIEISGEAEDEILAMYRIEDTFGLFATYGFTHPSEIAFSLPMKLPLGKLQLEIEDDTHAAVPKSDFQVPQLRREGDNIIISHLMIGSSRTPRLPRGIFRALVSPLGMQQAAADEVFDAILHRNRMKFYALLETIEACDVQMAVTLRKMVRYQLNAMSHCMGSRNPDEPFLPPKLWSD